MRLYDFLLSFIGFVVLCLLFLMCGVTRLIGYVIRRLNLVQSLA